VSAARKAILISANAPELDRLAAELAARGALTRMVRKYFWRGRRWERAAARLPLLRSAYASTFGRRAAPAGIDANLIVDAGVAWDFAAALVNRAGRSVPSLAAPVSRRLLACTERAVGHAASVAVNGADVVIGSYHVAEPAFARARRQGVRTVLNYPIAHHRWQYEFFAEQAAARPEFASALPAFGNVRRHSAALDPEIELADAVLVGSDFVRNTFVAQGVPSSKIAVVPYGVDAARFAPAEHGAERRPFRVLFVGQIGERKGVSYLLEAYESFKRPGTELALVGDLVNGGEAYRRFAGLFEHVPNVPHARLPQLFRTADVFVLPTLVEGMPLVVLEAMASGLPVIVTPNGPAEVVRDGVDGYVVPIRDSEAIAARLDTLYRSPELRREMGRNARLRAEQWSWQRYAKAAADVALRGEAA
jgi:glycosyltransferase involved in cell wall biosynthesis